MVAANKESAIDELCCQASVRLRVGHGCGYVAVIVRAVVDGHDVDRVERLMVSAVATHGQNFEHSFEAILQVQSFVSIFDLK